VYTSSLDVQSHRTTVQRLVPVVHLGVAPFPLSHLTLMLG
jgi:hypothetical protein